jgi:light-harvesting protein B-800-850 alpha chain
MNQARIWLVVNPTVGLPLFLGTVTGLSLLVHYSVLSHTTWFAEFLQGGKKAKAAAETSATEQVGELVLPNGAKVKFSIEGTTPRPLEASAQPERLIASFAAETLAPSPASKPPPLVLSDSTETASTTPQ